MRVAISGITSYTGMCIAEALARDGHRVYGLARSPIESYTCRRRTRLTRAAAAGVELIGNLPAENEAMTNWVRGQALDAWVLHHHPMERYRSLDYDVEQVRRLMLGPSRSLLNELAKVGGRFLLYSGTYFEPGEGGHSHDTEVSPYGTLKSALSGELERACTAQRLRFAKIVVPWPCGALENDDRLTPRLLRAAENRERFSLTSPHSIMDVLPGESVGLAYAHVLERMSRSDGPAVSTFRPSGRVTSALDWAEFVRVHIACPLGLAEHMTLALPQAGAEAPRSVYANPSEQRMHIDWDEFAARYVREWRELASPCA